MGCSPEVEGVTSDDETLSCFFVSLKESDAKEVLHLKKQGKNPPVRTDIPPT